MELLHDLPVDPIANAQHPFPVHVLDGLGGDRRDAPKEVAVVPLERTAWPHERQRRPRATSAAQGSDQQIVRPGRVLVADETSEQVEVPFAISRNGKQQLGARPSFASDGDASVCGVQQFAGITQYVTKGLLRPLRALQMRGQPIKKFERLEFPCRRQHAGLPIRKPL